MAFSSRIKRSERVVSHLCVGSIDIHAYIRIRDIPRGKTNILGGHSIGHSKKKSLYEHVSYSERFPIFGAQYF
jgi:hypothetical protein